MQTPYTYISQLIKTLNQSKDPIDIQYTQLLNQIYKTKPKDKTKETKQFYSTIQTIKQANPDKTNLINNLLNQVTKHCSTTIPQSDIDINKVFDNHEAEKLLRTKGLTLKQNLNPTITLRPNEYSVS